MIHGLNREPAVGIEPTTARLRIGCSTTELRWRTVEVKPSDMPWRGLEPRRLSAPPPQDGVSTNFTTRAETTGNGERSTGTHQTLGSPFALPTSLLRTGLTGLEPATSGVTDRHSNQAELQPQIFDVHVHLPNNHTCTSRVLHPRHRVGAPNVAADIAPTGIEPVFRP